MNKHFEIHLTLRKERSDLASKKTELNFVRERECVCVFKTRDVIVCYFNQNATDFEAN